MIHLRGKRICDGPYITTSLGNLDWFFEKHLGDQVERLTDGKKFLEPTAIDKPSPAERFGVNPQIRQAMDRMYDQAERDRYFINPFMRMMGYTRHPAACTHERKKYTDSAMRWRCADCGADI